MGLREREREHEVGSSSVSLNGIVSHLVPGDKYTRLEVDDAPTQEIELNDYSNVKQHSKYNKLSELVEEEISLADDEEDKLSGVEEGLTDTTSGEVRGAPATGLWAKLKQIQENNIMKIAWACTILGVICTGWIGPCFKLLGSKGVAAARRASWRSQVLLMLLIIPAIGEYRTLTSQQKRELWNKQTIFQLILCATLWLCDLLFWSNALDYTTVSSCSVFANTASLMIMVWSLVRRQPLSGLEILGGVIGFAGLLFAVVLTYFFGSQEADGKAKNWLLGNVLALASAASVAAYVVNATKVRTKVSVFVYTISNTLFLFIGLSSASFIFEGTKFDTSVDGIFGWVEPRFLVVVALLSVVAGLIGFNLNNVALRYMPPLGYSLVALCDPVISSTYAWFITDDGVPGVFTILGGLITLGGIVVLVIGEERRKAKDKQRKLQESQETTGDAEETNGTDENRPKGKVVLDFVASDGTAA